MVTVFFFFFAAVEENLATLQRVYLCTQIKENKPAAGLFWKEVMKYSSLITTQNSDPSWKTVFFWIMLGWNLVFGWHAVGTSGIYLEATETITLMY